MLRHYISMALRGIARHKLYSLINIFGLAVGLACVIFIALFIRYETSYDKWVPDSDRLYRIELTDNVPGRPPINTALISFPMAVTIRRKVPGVSAATRLRPEAMTVTVGRKQFWETVDVVDPNFLQVIRLPLLSGNRARALTQPESVVLSESTARKFFGNSNPIGRTITTYNRGKAISLAVTGVLYDLPANSQLKTDLLMPDTSLADRASPDDKDDWLSQNYYGYLKLAPGIGPETVIARFRPILDQILGPALRKRRLTLPANRFLQMHMTHFAAVHLDSSDYVQNLTPPGSWITVYGMAVIGALILLLACFNFTNLATARAALRAREISLRKCVGASRRQLAAQLLGESIVMTLCSLALALVLVETLLPAYDGLLGQPIAFHYLTDWPLSLAALGIALGAGLLSGAYPALILSTLRPGPVLRANAVGNGRTGSVRTVLVALQFAVSIALGISAIVVWHQITFSRHIDLGFDPDHIVATPLGAVSNLRSFMEARQVLLNHPGVLGMTLSDELPFSDGHGVGLVQLPGHSASITLHKIQFSPNFPLVYRIPLLAGRLLSLTRADDMMSDGMTPGNDGHSILVNKAAAARFGFTPNQAIGKTIIYNTSPVHIVGVLANTKFRGSVEPVRPTVYFFSPANLHYLSFRISNRNVPEILSFIERTVRSFEPTSDPPLYFLSARAGTFYQSYRKHGALLEIFVAIAMSIACLGLFGLAAFTAERRTLEIGIRKIAGARNSEIVTLLLWRISVPVLLANVVAWPVAYAFIRRWLDGFAYRIPLDPVYFLAAGAAALLVAWATVFTHSLRLAHTHPVRALRYE